MQEKTSRREWITNSIKFMAGAGIALTGLDRILCPDTSAYAQAQCKEPVYDRITMDEIMGRGIWKDTPRWNEVMSGKVSGLGKSGAEWREYLASALAGSNYALGIITPHVTKTLAKLPYGIKGYGGGGSWDIMVPEGIVEWGDESMLDKIEILGLYLHYHPKIMPSKDVIMHEYCHATYDLFGAFAGKKSRLINKEEFRKDVLRMIDCGQYFTDSVRENLREHAMDREKIDSLTEAFATIGMIFVRDEKLPKYITRHYRNIIKTSIINNHTL